MANFTGAGRVAGYGLRVAGLSISDLGFGIWDLKDDVSELRDTGCGVRVAGLSISDCFDWGFWIADFGFNGKAHGAQKLIADSSQLIVRKPGATDR
jgi:hypothetical protein